MFDLITRRGFLGSASAAGAASFLPAIPANEKLSLACVGVGGMGGSDLGQLSRHPGVNVVALCDVDTKRLESAASKHKEAKTFTDFREMFDKMAGSIDGVSVSTPDHMHAAISMTAINAGKHVYCQKPMCHDVFEARQVTVAARKKGLVTQMCIQIHSHEAYRTAVKLIHDGAIGKVKEAHSWSGKTWGWTKGRPAGSHPVPGNLKWDSWLGTAPERPYFKGLYHPSNWRRWFDFGCGTMGDMSIHILDPVASALEIGYPTSLISASEPPFKEAFSVKNRVDYVFPGTKYTVDPLPLTWYDGGFRPDTSGWPVKKIPGQGSMFVGEKGYVLLPHVGMPQLLPKERFKDTKVEKVPGTNHWRQWVDACMGKGKASANFDYSGPLTEFVVLGVVANRVPKVKLTWNSKALKIEGSEEANALVKRTYRKGWEVPGL